MPEVEQEAVEIPQTAAARRAEGQAKGRATVKNALALYRSMGSEVATTQELRAMALAAMPRILKRWVNGALGRYKGWPASVQVRAGENVAGIAAVAIQARSEGADDTPLSESTLGQLEETLSGLLGQVQKLKTESAQPQAPEEKDVSAPNLGVEPESAEAPLGRRARRKAPPAAG